MNSFLHVYFGFFFLLNHYVLYSLEKHFPPVFGQKLVSKIAKCGERVAMDIEVSGTPSPTVVWYKDDKELHTAPISAHKVSSIGNCHKLVIDKGKLKWIKSNKQPADIEIVAFIFIDTVCKEDAGKIMVKAVNEAGETQSIADFIVVDATPERFVDIVNTVTVENIDGQRVCSLN